MGPHPPLTSTPTTTVLSIMSHNPTHLTNISPIKFAWKKVGVGGTGTALRRRNIYAGTSMSMITPTKHTTGTTLAARESAPPPGAMQYLKDYGYGVLEQPEYFEVDIDPQSSTPPYDFPRKSGQQLRYGCINPLPFMSRDPVDGPSGYAAKGRK